MSHQKEIKRMYTQEDMDIAISIQKRMANDIIKLKAGYNYNHLILIPDNDIERCIQWYKSNLPD